MLFPATILFRRQFARAYFEIRYALRLVCLDERELLTRSFSPLFFSSVAYREGNCEKEKKEKRYVRRSRRRTRLTPLLFDGFPREEQHEGGEGGIRLATKTRNKSPAPTKFAVQLKIFRAFSFPPQPR